MELLLEMATLIVYPLHCQAQPNCKFNVSFQNRFEYLESYRYINSWAWRYGEIKILK